MQQNKLYVGNISFTLTPEAVKEAFSSYGENEVQMVTDRSTGRSRGFAFVTFDKQHSAEMALEMSGKELGGRKLIVNMAKERTNNRGRQSRHY